MSRNNSQPQNKPDLESLIFKLIPLIPKSVYRACLRYGHYPLSDEVVELSQDVFLHLIEDKCRRLKSYDHRASLEIWLQSVVNRFVLGYLQNRKRYVSLEDAPPQVFVYQSGQEEKVLFEERLELLNGVAGKLSKGERKLLELLCLDIPTDEIGMEMRIKTQSVYRYKSVLFNKLRNLLGGGGL
ncbi:MAG: sigma-70 family RNA polymerase sigma factor [Acidobacteria bacterium]|nr:sigma-70 family RNA polymerase sigma factor [Acidobacteriota bacterium]